MSGFRHEPEVRKRIARLLELCGEEPSAAFAKEHQALPLTRDEGGWTAIRPDGTFIFVDDATGRIVTDLPAEWRQRAEAALQSRYPGVLDPS